MENKNNNDLDLSLPTDSKSDSKSNSTNKLQIILIALLLLITIVILIIQLTSNNNVSDSTNTDSDIMKKLAIKLENRKLYNSAAQTWQIYLNNEDLNDNELAKYQYRIAKLFYDAGDYEQCLLYLFKSEETEKIESYTYDINRLKLDCFRKTGNLAGLNAELSSSTNIDNEGEKDNSLIIAEIGADKITTSQLDKIIEDQIDAQLSQYAMFMEQDQLMQQKEMMRKQFDSPENRNRALSEWIGQELLYREAIKNKITDDKKIQRAFETLRRAFFAQHFINNKIKDEIKISESDLQDYYKSHISEFQIKENLQLSRIVVEDKQKAESIIAELKSGLDFAEAVKKYSIDNSTSENEGKLTEPVEKGQEIKGFGKDPKALSILFSLKINDISNALKSDDNMYHIYRIDNHEKARTKEFDEVKSEISQKKTEVKRKEIIDNQITTLKKKYNVVIHQEAIKNKEIAEKQKIESKNSENEKQNNNEDDKTSSEEKKTEQKTKKDDKKQNNNSKT